MKEQPAVKARSMKSQYTRKGLDRSVEYEMLCCGRFYGYSFYEENHYDNEKRASQKENLQRRFQFLLEYLSPYIFGDKEEAVLRLNIYPHKPSNDQSLCWNWQKRC